jgi:hypothetical protein
MLLDDVWLRMFFPHESVTTKNERNEGLRGDLNEWNGCGRGVN